jgi:hypothetical protein
MNRHGTENSVRKLSAVVNLRTGKRREHCVSLIMSFTRSRQIKMWLLKKVP